MIYSDDNVLYAFEKIAIGDGNLVKSVVERAIWRAGKMLREATTPGEKRVAQAYLARQQGKMRRINQLAAQRSGNLERRMETAARGGTGTHAIPEYVRGGGARDLANINRFQADNARMQNIAKRTKGGAGLTEEGAIKRFQGGTGKPGYEYKERLMGVGGKWKRPLTTTDPQTGKKTTKWIHATTDGGPRWPAVNPEFWQSGLMRGKKGEPGRQMVREALAHYRKAPAHKLDVRSGMKQVDADALRRSRGQIDARGRTLPPAPVGPYPRRLRQSKSTFPVAAK